MEHRSAPASGRALLLAAIVLVGLNLRPFITGIGPLASDISAQTGLGLQGIALLTLMPMFLMGVLAFAGPPLQVRMGARRSIVAALAVLAIASFLRLFVSTGWQMVAAVTKWSFAVRSCQRRSSMGTGCQAFMTNDGEPCHRVNDAQGQRTQPPLPGVDGGRSHGALWEAAGQQLEVLEG